VQLARTGGPALPRVLILGGGFAGVATAQRLERLLRAGEADVTLVSRENYSVFTPMLPEVFSGSLETRHVVTPVRAELRRTRFVLAEVTEIDLDARTVRGRHPIEGTIRELGYDQLVIGLGAAPTTFNLPGIAEHTLPLKTLEDAETLRNHIISTLELADVAAPDERKLLLSYVIVGGGYTGVEAAGELVDFFKSVAHFYRTVGPDDVRIVLIEGGASLLPGLAPKMGRYAARNLLRRGVGVELGTNVASADAEGIALVDGRRFQTRTIVWSAGTRPAPLVADLPVQHGRGGTLVANTDLSIPGRAGVWAIGDAASIQAPDGSLYPPTAQHAIREGPVLARNIVATLRGEPTRPFVYASLGMMASLGARRGVAEIARGWMITGFIAWVLWRTYYLSRLPGLDRKVRVALDWTLGLIFPRDIAELRVYSERARREATREPSQEE
jgi:NADH:ubiquinone reductase (H+-translocating)